MRARLIRWCCLVVAATALAPATASAVELEHDGVMAQRAQTFGVPQHNERIAVDHTTGNVLLADTINDRVVVYSAAGAELDAIGVGELSGPFGLAIDQSNGDLYVADAGNERILRYDRGPLAYSLDITFPSPAVGRAVGEVDDFAAALAVDPTTRDLLVADPGRGRISRYAESGTFLSSFNGSTSPGGAFDGLLDVAAGNDGDVLVVDSTGDVATQQGTSRVERFAADGSHLATLPEVPAAATVTVRPATGEIVVSGDQDAVYRDSVASLHVFDPDGVKLSALDLDSSALYNRVTGLAFDDGSDGRLYVATDVGHWGVDYYGDPSIQIYLPVPPPQLSDVAVDEVGRDYADVSATVDPTGYARSWRIEISTNGGALWSPKATGTVPAGSDPVTLAGRVEGLDARTEYLVRVSFPTAGVASDALPFETLAAPPRVRADAAEQKGQFWMLRGAVDPQAEPTTYWFEYGPTAAYGSRIPAGADGDAGSGNAWKAIAHAVDLEPDTTYHYRLVATNSQGTVESEDRTFTPRAADPAPYELVTPPDSIADVRWYGGGERPSTPSGDTVCFGSIWSPDGTPASGGTQVEDVHCARRGTDSWTTENVAMPRGAPDLGTAWGAILRWTSPDGARSLFTSDFKGITPDRPMTGATDTDHEVYLRAGGQTTWISRVDSFSPGQTFRQPVDASTELDHVLYTSEGENNGRLLEWTPSGVRPVAVDESDVERSGSVALDGSGKFAWGIRGAGGTMSRDGERIFFQSNDQLVADEDGAGQDVYVREGGETTRIVSPRRGPAGALNASFAGASDDGDVAYVTTSGQLTGDPKVGTALYRYTLSSDQLELVEDGILAVLEVSGDGSTAVFSGFNLLAGTDGLSLYAARDGDVTRIGPLAGSDMSTNNRAATQDNTKRALRITHDGSVVAYAAEADTPGLVGVYRWSAGDGLEVVSDDSSTKVAALFGNVGDGTYPGSRNAGRGMTDDGSVVYFETAAALVEGDVNDDGDVYAWRDGEPRLLTPGRFAGKARYLDNSADGSTVFFTTYERIRPREDTNAGRDVYAWRTGPVFPEPPPGVIGAPPDPRTPGVPPAGPAIDSLGERDGQQGEPGAQRSLRLAKPSAAALRGAARTGRLRVPVKVGGGGRVTVTVKARIGGKLRTVGRATRTAKGQRRQTLRVPVRLSRAARARIARGSLRLKISARAGGKTTSVTVLAPRGGSAATNDDARKQG